MKPAISTVAFPDRTLTDAIDFVRTLDVNGIELRTFGDDTAQFAADPCLSSFAKTKLQVADAGLELAGLATSIRYDAPIFPPVVGRVISETDLSVRATRRMIEIAAAFECPFVRVFAFEMQGKESRRSGMRRIVERLALAAACARNTGVRLLLENGGSFATAEDIGEIIDRVGSPLVASAYNPAVAQAVGEDPISGIRTLRNSLESVKLKDFQGTSAVMIGDGEMRCQETVSELERADYQGWVVLEWDRIWLKDLASAEEVMPEMVRRFFSWRAEAKSPSREPVTA